MEASQRQARDIYRNTAEDAVVPLENQGWRARVIADIETVVLRGGGNCLVGDGVRLVDRRNAIQIDPGFDSDRRRPQKIVYVCNDNGLAWVVVELERLSRLARSEGNAAVDRADQVTACEPGVGCVPVGLEPGLESVGQAGGVKKDAV